MIFYLGRNFKCSKSQLITINKELNDWVVLEVLVITPQPKNGPSTLGRSVDKGCIMIFGLGRNFKCSKSQLIILIFFELSDPVALEGLKIMHQPENGPSTLGNRVLRDHFF